MKRIVWKYGLMSGGILSAIMLITLPLHNWLGFEGSLVIGYATMVLSFLFIFFGVRAYRDTVVGGVLSFGKALAVGSLIATIASSCYVATWEFIYFKVTPDYLEKYNERMLAKLKSEGLPQAELDKEIAKMHHFEQRYQNPFFNAAVTFVEPLPVGLVIALVTAGVLRKRRDADVQGRPIPVAP